MRAQDRADFIEWASARKGGLLGTAYVMVGDHHLAEDIVQEALTKTYVAWPRIRDTSKAEAYARRAVARTAISWWRRKSSHERPCERLPDEAGRDTMADDISRRDSVWVQLQALPIRQRSAIVLRFYEDLSVADTAHALGCSEGSVKSQVSRGLARLKETLGDIDELTETRGRRS
jgi:RNA polymerase sigma-70 factor (sigma-E family)